MQTLKMKLSWLAQGLLAFHCQQCHFTAVGRYCWDIIFIPACKLGDVILGVLGSQRFVPLNICDRSLVLLAWDLIEPAASLPSLGR